MEIHIITDAKTETAQVVDTIMQLLFTLDKAHTANFENVAKFAVDSFFVERRISKYKCHSDKTWDDACFDD